MTPTIRQQLETYKTANSKLESALGNGALAKKAVVAQQLSDQLWTDPITQEVYKRYPVTITTFTPGVVLVPNVAAQRIGVFTYPVREGTELQFLPQYPEHYIVGGIFSAVPARIDDFEAVMECWDTFFREYRGMIWVGTTRDINDSNVYRQNGHPLLYNGEKEIRASGGDNIILFITTPVAGALMVWANSNFAIRVFQLTRIRQG